LFYIGSVKNFSLKTDHMSNKNPTLALASTSVFRKELLLRLQIAFEVVDPRVEETQISNETAEECASRLSVLKAHAGSQLSSARFVIGSDQVAECDGRRLGKPGSKKSAREQLMFSSGNFADFFTAVCVHDVERNRDHVFVDKTVVQYRVLTDLEIDRYLDSEDVLSCAGSAKSEGLGISLLDSISGVDPTALVGLPLIQLAKSLRSFGFLIP